MSYTLRSYFEDSNAQCNYYYSFVLDYQFLSYFFIKYKIGQTKKPINFLHNIYQSSMKLNSGQ